MRANRSQRGVGRKCLCAVLVVILLSCQSIAQTANQTTTNGSFQPKSVSLAHLYWHFLVHQNHLDSLAASMESRGVDGSALRNDLQVRLHLSDAEFGPIRASSRRLAAELDGLDQQAAAMRALGASSANSAKLAALVVQREAYINAEISYLSASLTPRDKAILESFMAQFFAPKTISVPATSLSGQSTTGTVQP
jgi:hypothetical protein